MKKIWIILCAVCFVMVGCNIEVPDFTDENDLHQNETSLSEIMTSNPAESGEIDNEVSLAGGETISGDKEPIGIGGGGKGCIHDTFLGVYRCYSYHNFDSILIGYVGAEAFEAWRIEAEPEKKAAFERGEVSCPFISIVDYKNYFDVPEIVFELADTGYPTTDYNIDAIFSGEKAAEEYYTSERLQILEERWVLYHMKLHLASYAENQKTEYAAWINKKNTTGWWGEKAIEKINKTREDIPAVLTGFTGAMSQYSIPELVSAFNIPREVVEEAYAKSVAPDFKGMFDIDALYSSTKASTDYKTMNPLDIDMQYIIYPENSEK